MGRTMNRDAIIGLPVICQQTGKRLGLVEDILYEPEDMQIKGIIVASMGYRSKMFSIDFDKIQAFGEVSVMVGDDCEEKTNYKGQKYPVGRTIIRDDGQELGSISNVIFNPDDGHIEGYEISKGVIDDLVVGRSILSGDFMPHLDKDMIVIPAEQNIELKPNNRGILNILSDSRDI